MVIEAQHSREILNMLSVLNATIETNALASAAVPTTAINSIKIELADAATRYASWLPPTTIISDGAYGLGMFPGDPPTPTDLAEWYAPHIAAWAYYSLPETTLWFWCNEIGWANVHPILAEHGWQYRALHVWDKGIGHIAGNVNSKTIRRFPVVSEVCVHVLYKLIFVGNVIFTTYAKKRSPVSSTTTVRIAHFPPKQPDNNRLGDRINEGFLAVFVVEHDALDSSVPRITKGTDGRALI